MTCRFPEALLHRSSMTPLREPLGLFRAIPRAKEGLLFREKGNCPGMEIASTEGKRQRKRFFFEKKK
jgi:hypothetical protein